MAQSKYSVQIFINGSLFADLTGIAKERHFTLTRNDADDIEFSVGLDALNQLATTLNQKPQDLIQPGVAEVRMSREGQVLTAGQITNWDVNLGSDENRTVKVKARGWLELFKYRLTSAEYTSRTAAYIIQDQINTTQALTHGNFGITIGNIPTPDLTNLYPTKSYSDKVLYDLFVELTQEHGGFDMEITWNKIFNLYFPNMGIIREDVIFTYPGNVKNIEITSDIANLANEIFGRGSGYGEGQITTSPFPLDNASSQQTYQLRQGLVDYPDVTDQTQLTNLSQSHLNYYKDPLVIHKVTIDSNAPGVPVLGSYHLGDKVSVSVKNLPLYSDINSVFSIDKIDAGISGEDQEEIVLTLNPVVS